MGAGGAFQRCGALMTTKNARTEARGFLVKFARCSAKFQWEIVLIHGGQISVSIRDRLKLGRGGVRCRSFFLVFFFWTNQVHDLRGNYNRG